MPRCVFAVLQNRLQCRAWCAICHKRIYQRKSIVAPQRERLQCVPQTCGLFCFPEPITIPFFFSFTALCKHTCETLTVCFLLYSVVSMSATSTWGHCFASILKSQANGSKHLRTHQPAIWPQMRRYFATHRHALCGGGEGGGTFHGGGTSWGVAYPWGVDFGPYLVEGWQGGGIYGGGSAKPKVLLLAKPLALQYYFAPFSKAAK